MLFTSNLVRLYNFFKDLIYNLYIDIIYIYIYILYILYIYIYIIYTEYKIQILF